MSNNDQHLQEEKKLSPQERMKKLLDLKKQKQTLNHGQGTRSNTSQTMKSQQTKKTNNQRKRQGV